MNMTVCKLAISCVIGSMLSGACFAAASVDISNVPMAVETSAPPNIQFTLDNSGSMGWTYLPDTEYASSPAYAIYVYNNGVELNCFANSAYNPLYYDPTKTYTPPVKSDGTLMPNAQFTAALYDGFLSYDSNPSHIKYNPYLDLSQHFQSDLYIPYVANSWYNGGYDTPQSAYYYAYKGGTPTPGTCYANNKYTLTPISTAVQQQNFANWFSYYRTRMQSMRTAMGNAFQPMPNNFRIGFNVLNDDYGYPNVAGTAVNPGFGFIALDAWTGSQKTNWFNNLYSMEPNGATPTPSALVSDGEYYSGNGMTGVASTPDPVQYSCQQNYAIVSTDGFWNNTNLYGQPSAGDQDSTAPNASWFTGVQNLGFTPGSQWPNQFYEGSSVNNSNTLADIAMKYWATDLRSVMTNNVAANQEDPATWQHMTTYGIGLEAGTLSFPSALTAITTGTQSWPDPTGANLGKQQAIDDLWHAAVNGHGQFLLATQGADTITAALQSVLSNITGRTGSAAAVAVPNANITSGNNSSYASSYNSGDWSGDLNTYPVDTITGQVSTTPGWTPSAKVQLDTLTSSLTSSALRYIGTYSGLAGVGFNSGGITAVMQSQLNTPTSPPGTGDWLSVLNFLRGVNGSAYRSRGHALGDIIDAEPVPVFAPSFGYGDLGYATFKSANASRAGVVYQGANDGMLHAFSAASGAESWAYVPGVLFNTPLSTTYPSTSSLVNLSLKTGFQHLNYVDGTPVEGDVDFANTIATASGTAPTTYTPNWHSILVGGLGSGGNGYYALDITNPSAASDSAVASKVLWEFPQASNSATYASEVGLTYGKPVMVKTVASGWVVMVTSGYNNGDGKDHLFVLNPQTGTALKDIATPSGHGLAKIAAYVQNGAVDNTTPTVYGGDLDGNVWKFDFSGATVASWNVSLLASLVDSGGAAQPITSTPELAQIGSTTVVYVGTGQYLGNSDVPNLPGGTPNTHATQTQTMYAMADTGTPITNVRGSTMVQQTLLAGSSPVTIVNQSLVDFTVKQGWYVDLTAQGAASGERVYTDPYIAEGILTFTTNKPDGSNPCLPGGKSWLYNLDITTGGAVLVGGNAAPVGQYIGAVLASRPSVVSLPSGKIIDIIGKSDATTASFQAPTSQGGGTKHRVSWQEVD